MREEMESAVSSAQDVLSSQQAHLSKREAVLETLRAELAELKADRKLKADQIASLSEALEDSREEFKKVSLSTNVERP